MLKLRPPIICFSTVVAMLLVPGVGLLFADSPPGEGAAHDKKGLAELATAVRPGFLMGAHTKSRQLESATVRAILRGNYNLVSVGIYQKHTTQKKARDDWDFSGVDPVIEFAARNGMTVYAHPMFGSDNYVPDWLLNGEFTDDEILQIIEERIRIVLTRYRGKIHVLDVYNEGLHRGGKGWREEENLFLRLGYHRNKFGRWPVALEKMLVWCRKYGGEDLKLIYNDNRNTHPGTQSEECIRLFKALKAEGIPIDGIGIQLHTQITADGKHQLNGHERAKGAVFDADLFARNLRAMGEAGAEVYVSECDVHLYGTVDQEKLDLQADAYRSMLKVCIEEPACKAFKTWGFTDASCWKPMSKRNPAYKYEPCPLVFDHDLRPKPAYRAMRELLAGMSARR